MEATIRADEREAHGRTSPSAPATRCRSTGTSTSTTSAPARCPPALERARARAWRRSSRAAPTAGAEGAGRCLSGADVELHQRRGDLRRLALRGRGRRASQGARRPPLRRPGHGHGRHQGLGPAPVRRGLRRGRPRRARCSTTAAGASLGRRAAAGRLAAATTARTSPTRSASPPASTGSIPAGSSSGAGRGAPRTSSTTPPRRRTASPR